jgi:hypothetical protein
MDDIEKSRHGRYEDNAKNRRLHRVGQEYGSKKQEDETVDPSKLTLDQLHKEINELGHILGGRIKDGRRTEDVEKRISDLLKYAPDKVLESTLEALRTNVKPNPTAKIAAKLTEMEINRRKTEGSAKQTEKKEETPKEEPKAQSEEPETYTRVKFDDVPQSGKVNLKKYLSNKIRAEVDKAWKDKAKIGDKTLQDMEKGMVAEFNKNFDNLSKSKRAEALYSIMTVKAEIARRGRGAKNEEKQGEQLASKQETPTEKPKVDYKKPESFNELYTRVRNTWSDIMETKPKEVDFTKPKEVAEMASAFFPGTTISKVDGEEEYMVQYPGDASRFMRIDKYTSSPKALNDKIRMFLSMDMDMRTRQNFSNDEKEKFDRIFALVAESVADRALVKDMNVARTKAFEEQVDENNRNISRNVRVRKGKPMSFEEANQGRGNPKYRSDELFRINCQTCVVIHELRLRGFDLGAKPKTSSAQFAMAKDSSYAWIDPLTGQQPEAVRITCAPENKVIKVRKSQKSKSDLRKNILEATKEVGRYNFSYGWENGKDSSGHIITAERHADGNLTFYDPQNGKSVPMVELLDEVSPKYLCRIIRVDNLLIKPDIVKDYAMQYE